MNEIRERLVQRLNESNVQPNILRDRESVEIVSERVAEWLTVPNAEPNCSIRAKGLLITAERQETVLQLLVFPTSFQIDDSSSPAFGEHRGGPSIVEPDASVTVIRIPLSEIFGEQELS
jgi:hypothetical protein